MCDFVIGLVGHAVIADGLVHTVDASPSLIYKSPMVCAFPRLMKTDSRGFAVGPEGMRVR